MKLVIITSNHKRHKFFASKLVDNFSVIGIMVEEKKRDYSKKGEGTEFSEKIKRYFKSRDDSEEYFFGSVDWQNTCRKVENGIVSVSAGGINNESNVALLKKWNPDYIAVFGSSIIGEEIINLFPSKIINMHLGLSPFYRGSGTNFWPLYDEKLEYVGVTIHYLDKGIDTGKIIIQGKPEIIFGDTVHSIGNKTILKGTDLFVDVLHRIENGEKIESKEQNLSIGKLCLFKDCLPEHIIELEQKFRDGLVEKYLKRISKIGGL